MRFMQPYCTILISTLLILPCSSWARSQLEGRLERLENIVASKMSIDVLNQIDILQQEIREVRGLLEEQDHEIQLLNQRQEKLYVDLDHRINKLVTANNNLSLIHI